MVSRQGHLQGCRTGKGEQSLLKLGLHARFRRLAGEHRITAGDIGPHAAEADALTEAHKLRHGKLPGAADIDGPQQSDISGHSR